MPEAVIDRLAIEVSGDASKASAGFDQLVKSLGRLESKLASANPRLTEMASSLRKVASSLGALDASKLSALGSMTVKASTGKNLQAIANSMAQISPQSISALRSLGDAMTAMRSAGGSSSSFKWLQQLPTVLREFTGLDMGTLVNQMRQLNTVLEPLSRNVQRLSDAYSKMPKSMRSAAVAARSVTSANANLAASNQQLATSAGRAATAYEGMRSTMSGVRGVALKLTVAWMAVKKTLGGAINEVNTYIENMNLFEASMGKYTQGALDFAEKVQDAMGVDMGEWARNQGVFMTLATGMGVTADRASVMSQQLTQLGYDISSFYNMDVNDAMLKIQSGIAGELEPLRRIGWDLSDTRMNAEAAALGISKSTKEMTQAEKVALRYHLIMTQVTQTHGDMARTIMSPANQLRILQAQLTMTARSIGNLFIPMLNMILPYAIAVTKVIRQLAQAIADLLGIDAKFEVDYSGLDTSGIALGGEATEDLSNALDDAGNSASKATKKIKEYKNTVMGFDELNKLNDVPDPTDYSASGAGAGADAGKVGDISGLIPMDSYDFMKDLKDNLGQMTDEIAEKMMKWLPVIGAVGAALTAAFAASKLLPLLGGLETLGSKLRFVAGVAMAVGGAALYAYGWFDAWNNGVHWDNLLMMLGGMALMVVGLGLAFGPVGAAIGGIVGLLGLGVVSLKDMIQNGATWENEIGAAVSALGLEGLSVALTNAAKAAEGFIGPVKSFFGKAAVKAAPVLKFLGKFAGAIGVIVSVVDGLVNAKGIFDSVSEGAQISTENVFGLITSILGIGLALAPMTGGVSLIIAGIISAIVGLGAVIYNNWDEISKALGGFLGNIKERVAEWSKNFRETWGKVWEGAKTAVSEKWNDIKTGIGNALGNVKERTKEWSDNFRSTWGSLWDKLKTKASEAGNSIGDKFKGVGDKLQRVGGNIQAFLSDPVKFIQKSWDRMVAWFRHTVTEPIQKLFDAIKLELPTPKLPHFNWHWQEWGPVSLPVFDGIDWYAKGGFPEMGELFVAREAGPEMVGTMGNKNAVANNDQIVAGIKGGVMEAMMAVAPLFNQQSDAPVTLVLRVGNEDIARASNAGNASLARRGLAASLEFA